MAAVSTFVARRPTPREAASFGVKWALGHGASLLLLGLALFALKMALEKSQPALFSSGVLDRFVGLVLVGLGLWTLVQLQRGAKNQSHAHEHSHVHADGTTHSHAHGEHKHGSLLMGMLHGAAGTGAFVGQAALAVAGYSYAMVLAYTVAFSIGVLLAMGFYAGALGRALAWSRRRGARVLLAAQAVTGLLTCIVGVCLMAEVELPGVFFWLEH
jgi:sulfite exporter TauE/SafE